MAKHKIIPASYLIPMDGNKILLSLRQNTGYEDGNYSLIAGHVECAESFTQCMIREAGEEAGIIIREENMVVAHMMHRIIPEEEGNERVEAFFVTTEWEGKIINMEPEKCGGLKWFDMNKLPENTIPYIAQAIDGIKNGVFYSEHGF